MEGENEEYNVKSDVEEKINPENDQQCYTNFPEETLKADRTKHELNKSSGKDI